MRTIAYLVGGLIVLVGSFLITNWILSRNDGVNWKFTDEASLAAAAKAAGFAQSPDIHGGVDNVTRIDGERIQIIGWAADFSGDGTPINLTAFVDGRNKATFRTSGPRADITAGIKTIPKANPDAAKNVLFVASFSCPAGGKLFVVATTRVKNYHLLEPGSSICP